MPRRHPVRTMLGYVVLVAAAAATFAGIQSLGAGLIAPAPSRAVLAVKSAAPSVDALLHVLLALAVVLTAARLVGAVFRRLGEPPVIGEVIAGIMLGPSLLGRVWPAGAEYVLPPAVAPFLGVFAQVGVVLYMFLVGLDLNTGYLRRSPDAAVSISHASIIVPFLLGAALSLLLYPMMATSDVPFTVFVLFIGISMSVTAFPVLARILTDRGMHRGGLGAIAIACAAVDDVTAWCLLAFVVSVAKARVEDALHTLAFSLGFVAVVVLIVRPLLRAFVKREAAKPEVTAATMGGILVLLLLSAFTTEWIGIHALFGAFLLGAVIPHDCALASALVRRLHDFVVVFFLPAYFAFTGMRTQIGLVSGADQWSICGLIILVASLGKFGGTLFAARLTGLGWRDGSALGILMNTRGLMELIVLNIGLDLKVISPTLFAMLVIMAIVTTVATTPILDRLRPPARDRQEPSPPPLEAEAVPSAGARLVAATKWGRVDAPLIGDNGAGRPPGRLPRVLLAVPQSDAHVVANTLLEYFLKRRGCPVLNLGVCTPAADIAAAARDFAPDAILISSHNGHAFDDLRPLPEALAAAGAGHVPVYLGGNLSVGAEKQLADTSRFHALGIRVVTSFEAIDEILRLPPAPEEGHGDATAP